VVDAGSHKPVFDDIFASSTDVICSADYVLPDWLGARTLLLRGPKLVAVSHGGEALHWWTAAASGAIEPEEVAAVDTTGAGDVLHGAYCHALAAGLDREDALRSAVAVATERVRHLGPFAWRAAIQNL
jgi:sugar/nucleoside kinase (ribokinase family)